MGAYNWIIAILAIGFFGLLWICLNPVVSAGISGAYVETDEAALTVNLITICWKFLPIACVGSMFIYAYITGQKDGGI